MTIFPECVCFSSTHALFNVTVNFDGETIGKANLIIDKSNNIDYVDNFPLDFLVGYMDVPEKIKEICLERANFLFSY